MMGNRDQLLKDIGIVDFTLIELNLYLDTHPNDRNAMEYFNHYNKIRTQLTREFSRDYFPLNIYLSDSTKEWKWGLAPLPWEGGCA